jgi:CRISPR-associated helicase Cas3
VEAGGLSDAGTFDPDPDAEASARDVADERPPSSVRNAGRKRGAMTMSGPADGADKPPPTRLRVILRRAETGWTAEFVGPPAETTLPTLPAEPNEDSDALTRAIEKACGMRVRYDVPIGDDDEEPDRVLLYLTKATDPDAPPDFTTTRQTLDEHTGAVVGAAERIASALGLQEHVKKALILAARLHDEGKHRPRWQQMVGGTMDEPLAKSGRRHVRGGLLKGYRHEFGSLQDAMIDDDVKHLDEQTRELVLHLIASHHNGARPHFERRAYDNERYTTAQNEAAAIEVIQRFARLQQRFGRWGLAWLESLLRCADAMASRTAANGGRA